ncbi:MAG: AAA family ATPase [Vicinamibacterales bacterium]
MAIAAVPLVIGFTGPFGSGCSTSARILSERLQFRVVKLSDVIRTDWKREHHAEPTRKQMQEHGDSLRRPPHSAAHLAQQAIEDLESGGAVYKDIAIDGIRNVSEIDFLRRRFGHRFFLFALECPASERWERLKPDYESRGQTYDDFNADDKRDRDEEVAWGQQVQLCVDRSDVLLINDDEVTQAELRTKLLEFVNLMTGEAPRYATPAEILMNLAYSASHGSKCLKRQVGAVLVAAPPGQMGDVVGTGFNENPPQTHPCVEEPTYGADPKRGVRGSCYRDVVRFESLKKYAREGVRCTGCGQPLTAPTNAEPPWVCANCNAVLEKPFFPERAMTWCTAIHAEVAAILAAGHRARGTTLYTTTFPCFQCAEKIAQAGIAVIVFTEPYSDTQAADRLTLAKIETARFEGVRSSRFHEIFSPVRAFYDGQRVV